MLWTDCVMLINEFTHQDSIVSKEVFKYPHGSITLFAFDAGQGLSPHKVPSDAFVQVSPSDDHCNLVNVVFSITHQILDGEAEIIIGGVSHTVKKGQMVQMPAEVMHELKAHKQFKMMLTMYRNN